MTSRREGEQEGGRVESNTIEISRERVTRRDPRCLLLLSGDTPRRVCLITIPDGAHSERGGHGECIN